MLVKRASSMHLVSRGRLAQCSIGLSIIQKITMWVPIPVPWKWYWSIPCLWTHTHQLKHYDKVTEGQAWMLQFGFAMIFTCLRWLQFISIDFSWADCIDFSALLYSTVPYCAGSDKQYHTEVGLSYNTFILDDSTKYNQWACTEISTHTFPHTESYTDTSRHGYQLIILLLHDSLKVLIRFFILSDCFCSSTLCPSHLSMSFISAQCLCVQFSIKEGKSVWKRHTGSVQSQSLLKCCFQLYWYK